MDSAARLRLVEWGHVFCLKLLLADRVLLKDALKGECAGTSLQMLKYKHAKEKHVSISPAEGELLHRHECMWPPVVLASVLAESKILC